jgi:hypothetical protein
MQSLNFESLSIGDVVLTASTTKWHNIGNLGMNTCLYVVQSVDTENMTAVVANTGNGTANLLTTSTDGQTTIAPMSGNDPATTCEAFQMSHEEAIEKRMGERTQAERLLGHHLESRLDTITPRPVDQFIEEFYAKAHSTDQGTNSYVSDITAGYRLMRDLLEGVRNMYDKESAKEATLLEAIREESSKVYARIMALVKEADIKYVYSPEVVTLTTQAPYCNPRTFRVGTSIMREDEPYTITRVSATRAYITDINGEEVGYISSSKADGLKFTIKNAPVEDKRHRNKWEYATYPASTPAEMVKLDNLTIEVEEIMAEHYKKVQSMIEEADCSRVTDFVTIARRRPPHTYILSDSITHIKDFVNSVQKTQRELEQYKSDFFLKAERLTNKAYGL